MKHPIGVISHDDGSIELVDTVPAWAQAAKPPAKAPRAEDALPYSGGYDSALTTWVSGGLGDGVVYPAVWTDEDCELFADRGAAPSDGSVCEAVWALPGTLFANPLGGSDCGYLDCAEFGCWCPSFPGETFHCCSCNDPFDNRYECTLYARMCVGCCGHASCLDRWVDLVERSRL